MIITIIVIVVVEEFIVEFTSKLVNINFKVTIIFIIMTQKK